MGGHLVGKSASRTGRGLFVGPHIPRAGDTGARLDFTVSQTTLLLHYEGLTALSWAFKRVRKTLDTGTSGGRPYDGHRKAQIDAIMKAANGPAEALHLFETVTAIDAEREARLRAAGLILDLAPDFDAWMWQRHGAALSSFGFTR